MPESRELIGPISSEGKQIGDKLETKANASLILAIVSCVVAGFSSIGTIWNANTNFSAFATEVQRRKDEDLQKGLWELYQAIETANHNSCSARSNIHGSHEFKLAFGRAMALEKHHRNDVPVHVYHALADLGSQILTFKETEEYLQIAIGKSESSNDKSLSYQQLGAAHFRFDGLDGANANLRTARKSFQSAIDVLPQNPHTLRQRGLAYELWAAHEMYHDHSKEAIEKAALASECWKGLAEVHRKQLEAEMIKHLEDAKSGVEPNSPCRLSAAASSDPTIVTVPPLSRDKSLGVENDDGTIRMRFVTVVPVRTVDKSGKEGYVLISVTKESNYPMDAELPEAHYIKIPPTEVPLLPILNNVNAHDNSRSDLACGCS